MNGWKIVEWVCNYDCKWVNMNVCWVYMNVRWFCNKKMS